MTIDSRPLWALSLVCSLAGTAAAQRTVSGAAATAAGAASGVAGATLVTAPTTPSNAMTALPTTAGAKPLSIAASAIVAGAEKENRGCANDCSRCPLAATCKTAIAKQALAQAEGAPGRRLIVLQQQVGERSTALGEELAKAPETTLKTTFDEAEGPKGTGAPEIEFYSSVGPSPEQGALQRHARLSGTSTARPGLLLGLAASAAEHAATSVYPNSWVGRAHARFDAFLAGLLFDATHGRYGARWRALHGNDY
ncbi:MAG: hypothetical protein HY553_05395 [Elusimicrobia bacterium]|nr:hypothetical protein [Elusimicrobiota bacterium]